MNNFYFWIESLVVSIFFAVGLDKAAIPYWVNWLLITYVVIYAVSHITLSVDSIEIFWIELIWIELNWIGGCFFVAVCAVLLSLGRQPEIGLGLCHARSRTTTGQSERFLFDSAGQEGRRPRTYSILIPFKFYPNFIKILSKFYPNFMQILCKFYANLN